MDITLSGHYTYRRLLSTAAPCVVMMLVSSVYGIIDGLFISIFAGKTGFAAVNVMWPALMVVGAIGLMVGSGGAALLGKIKGEGNNPKANHVFSILIAFIVSEGILLSGLFALLCPSLARLLGADSVMLADCVRYGRICMLGMPFFMLQNAFQSFYMAAECPKLGTWMSIACGAVNIALDALFVWILAWGVTGAAIATVIAQIVGGVFPLVYFASRRLNRGSLQLNNLWSPRRQKNLTLNPWPYINKACSNGLSEYVGNISLSIVSICYNIQLMRYIGQDGVAAYGVVMYLAYLLSAFFLGYDIALTPVIGYQYGADNIQEQKSILRKSFRLILIAGIALTLAAELTADTTARLFVGYDGPLAALTTRAIRIYSLCFLICGWNMFVSALFTGLLNGLVSATASFMRSIVFEMAAVWALPAVAGIDGIWWAVNLAELLTLLFSVFLLFRHVPHLLR